MGKGARAAKPFRVIDTGVRGGRAQIAFDQALIELHKRGESPDTIRFLRFPPTVLIGRHQALGHEVKLDYCREHGVGLARRITGGGAIYLDEGQLGWELVFSRRRLGTGSLEETTRAICEAAAQGLSQNFGVDARFRPRNDIEVEGRKLCGTGGFFDGDTLIFQGTVLIDMDAGRMAACLNVPKPKLEKRSLGAVQGRVVTLKELKGGQTPPVATVMQALLAGFAGGLGVEPRHAGPSAEEEALARTRYEEEIGTDAFIREIDEPEGADVHSASLTRPGGTLSCHIRLEGPDQGRIREVLFTGDFFVSPPRILYDLEAALRGLARREAGEAAGRFLGEAKPDMLSISPGDFAQAVEAALAAAGDPAQAAMDA